MAGYLRGERDRAARLIDRVSPMLYRFFMAQMVSRRYAEDLVQDTWVKIHEARHSYRIGEPVLPWIYAIARHVRVDSYRKAQRIASHEQQVDVLPERAMRGAAARTLDLEELLGALPESQREVVTMLKISGLSLEETALATSSSVGSVKQKAHRAYKRLREILSGSGSGVPHES